MPDETAPTLTVTIDADTRPLQQQLADAAKARRALRQHARASLRRRRAARQGLRRRAALARAQPAELALKAAFKPLTDQIGAGLAGLLGGVAFAKGGVVRQGLPVPFAEGGVIASPIAFPLAGDRLGIAGERGAEAILPLARGPDGRLGVRADGGGGINITFNVPRRTPTASAAPRPSSPPCSPAPSPTATATCERGNRQLAVGSRQDALVAISLAYCPLPTAYCPCPSTKPASPPPSRAPPTAAPSAAPTSSCWARAPRSATPAGPTSRRSYNAGYGVKSLDDLHAVIAFFEERRGRLHGFRWRDPTDCKSCPPEGTPTALDQDIGTGDGATAALPARQDLRRRLQSLDPRHHEARRRHRPDRRRRASPRRPAPPTAIDHSPASSPSRPATSPRPAPSSPPASSSTCPSASTPTAWRSTCKASATAPSLASPSSKSACDRMRPVISEAEAVGRGYRGPRAASSITIPARGHARYRARLPLPG